MIKGLQYIIPALSGNVSIKCHAEIYPDYKGNGKDISENDFWGAVNSAKLGSLTSALTYPSIQCNLLTSDYSMDLKKFYWVSKDYFFDPININDHNTLVKEYPVSNFNNDFSWGCRRISSRKHSNNTYMFFAPLWTDGSLPEELRIYVKIPNHPTKIIHISLVSSYIEETKECPQNSLSYYLKRYTSQLDDKVLYLNYDSGYANIYGISLERGGVSTGKSISIRSLWSEYRTINRFDSILASVYKDSRYVIKQVLPLAFTFSLDKVLTYSEKRQRNIQISAEYIAQDHTVIPIEGFSTNYDIYNINSIEWKNGKYHTTKSSALFDLTQTGARFPRGILYPENQYVKGPNGESNITNVIRKYHLSEGIATIYSNHIHKELPRFCRWELCGNSETIPYIINASEDYNLSDKLGRYHIVPLVTHINSWLDIHDLQGSIAAASEFYNSYQNYWFEFAESSPVNVYNDTAFYKGVLYDLKGYNLKTFKTKLDIIPLYEENSVGLCNCLSDTPFDASISLELNNKLHDFIYDSTPVANKYLNKFYLIKEDNVSSGSKFPRCLGNAIPSFTPVLIASNSYNNYHLSHYNNILELLDEYYAIMFCGKTTGISSAAYVIHDIFFEGTDIAYYKLDFPSTLKSNNVWDSYLNLYNAGTNIGSHYIIDKLGRYDWFINTDNIDPDVKDIYYKKTDSNIKVIDARKIIDIQHSNGKYNIIYKGTSIPIIVDIFCAHFSSYQRTFIYTYNPETITEQLINAALRLFNESPNDVKESLDNTNKSDFIYASVSGEGYDFAQGTPLYIPVSYTDWDIVQSIYNHWTRPPLSEVSKEEILPDNVADIRNSHVMNFNNAGLGLSSQDEVLNYFVSTTLIECDLMCRYDIESNSFVDEPLESELYMTAENIEEFYRQIAENIFERQNINLQYNTKNAYIPIQYKYDLDNAIKNGNSKIYLAEYTIDLNNLDKRLVYELQLTKIGNEYYISAGSRQVKINVDMLDGTCDMIMSPKNNIFGNYDDFFECIVNETYGGGIAYSDFRKTYNDAYDLNRALLKKEYRLWCKEEMLGVSALGKYIDLLQLSKATARLFKFTSRHSNIFGVVSYPVSKANLKQVPFNSITLVDQCEFLESIRDYDKSKLPNHKYYTGSLPYIFKLTNMEVPSSYKAYNVPSATYSLDNNDGNGILYINMFVSCDATSFFLKHTTIDETCKDFLKRELNSTNKYNLLPFIKFSTLSYLYSLPFVKTPETINAPCNIVPRLNEDESVTLLNSYSGTPKLYRYYGWCRPLIEKDVYNAYIWGRTHKHPDVSENVKLIKEYKQSNDSHLEYITKVEYSSVGKSVTTITRPLYENNWFNNSIIQYLPRQLKYSYGMVGEGQLLEIESQAYKYFKKAAISLGFGRIDDTEERWKYLFFNYMVDYSTCPFGYKDNQRQYHLKFIYTLK